MLQMIPVFRYETPLTHECESTVFRLIASAASWFEPRLSPVNQSNVKKMAPAGLIPGTEFKVGGRP
jgi:hypothetical protein